MGENGENREKNKDFRGFHRVPLVSFWGEIGKKANKRTESGKLTKKQRRGGVALSKYNFVYCLRRCPFRFNGRTRTRTRGGTGSLKSRYPHYSRPKNWFNEYHENGYAKFYIDICIDSRKNKNVCGDAHCPNRKVGSVGSGDRIRHGNGKVGVKNEKPITTTAWHQYKLPSIFLHLTF